MLTMLIRQNNFVTEVEEDNGQSISKNCCGYDGKHDDTSNDRQHSPCLWPIEIVSPVPYKRDDKT